MKEILNNLTLFYSSWLHPAYNLLISTLVNNQYVIYILLAAVIVLSIIRKRIKMRILLGLIDFINVVIVLFLIIAAYNIFSPAISKFIKSNTSSTSQSGTTNTGTGTKQNTNTQQQTQPQTQTQSTKQLYYSVDCYSCWAEGCARNGYNYGGYDYSYYYYTYTLCKSCSCNDFKAQSFWK